MIREKEMTGLNQIKKRDYSFDVFRGLCMWSIPVSHFTRMGGCFSQDSWGGVVYITINVFIMQGFMFLSGYFSKNAEKSRKTAFKGALWPYLLSIPFFYVVRYIIYGSATLYFDQPPFAMWFMLALFIYKFFLTDFIKIPYFFGICMTLYMVAGCIPFLTEFLALGRIVSYLPFFMIGYYCKPEHIQKLRSLKKYQNALLFAVLIAVSFALAHGLPQVSQEWYLLRNPGSYLDVPWYLDIIMRGLIFILGAAWIILMLNILPNKDNYLAYVGRNTMPVYIFHLIIRQILKKTDITMGLFPMPESPVVYYLLIYALASLCVFVFSSKPVSKGYDFVVDGFYNICSMFMTKVFFPVMKTVEKAVSGAAEAILKLVEKQK